MRRIHQLWTSRRFFEIDAAHVQVSVLSELAAVGEVDPSVVATCLDRNGIDRDAAEPWHR